MRYICYYCENDILKKDNLYYCKNCNKNITENKVIKIINLNEEAKNGIFKCPNCKASDITYDYKKNLLKCNYCRSLYKDINIKNDNDKIKNLIGVTIGDATNNIDNNNDIVTIKCEGCGASVIINTKFPITRCSWCHQTLTLNKPLPSGVTPDKILPFKITKEKAFKSMKNYIKEYNNCIDNSFEKNLTLDNVYGVYLPYMTVNANIHAKFKGIGIHSNNHENVSEIKNEIYEIEREFDLYVKDLLIESSSKMSLSYQDRANNIINLILPFDVENAVKYNANYLKGNSLEIRDLNYKELEKNADTKFKNISRTLLRRDRIYYDKGVTYNNEDIKIIGTKWLTIYVPVYIYSFLEIKNNNKYLHYIAVNARTNKTMGSIATDDVKVKKSANMLILFILIIFLFMIPFLLFAFLSLFDFESEINFKLVLLFGLLLVFLFSLLLGISIHKIKLFVQKETIKKLKKENKKFDYEKLTNKSFSNIQKKDKRIK